MLVSLSISLFYFFGQDLHRKMMRAVSNCREISNRWKIWIKLNFNCMMQFFVWWEKHFFFFLVGKALKRVLSVIDHHKFWYNISLHFAMSLGLILFLFSCSVMSDSLWPHGLQHTRLPWPSPSLRFSSDSYPLIQWWEYQSD